MSSKGNRTCVGKKKLADEDKFVMDIREAPPAHLLIEIQPFSKFLKHGTQRHESREFVAGDYKWRLLIYPSPEAREGVSVYLSLSGIDDLPVGWSFTADCNILVHNQDSDNYFCFGGKNQRFDANNWQWGLSISKSMLTEPYIIDDKCVFGAEVFPIKRCTTEYLSLHEWKIPNFSKLESVWISEEFPVGGFKWRMSLYPKGNNNGEESISIYLESVDHRRVTRLDKVKVDYCIRLRNNVSHDYHSKHASNWFSSSEYDWGFVDFFPTGSEMGKRFIVNDCCFVEILISVRDVVFTHKRNTLK